MYTLYLDNYVPKYIIKCTYAAYAGPVCEYVSRT
jgi:hypothetical protein